MSRSSRFILRKGPMFPLKWRLCGTQASVWTCLEDREIFFHAGIRTPDRPARILVAIPIRLPRLPLCNVKNIYIYIYLFIYLFLKLSPHPNFANNHSEVPFVESRVGPRLTICGRTLARLSAPKIVSIQHTTYCGMKMERKYLETRMIYGVTFC
jgi:hypothetical protein